MIMIGCCTDFLEVSSFIVIKSLCCKLCDQKFFWKAIQVSGVSQCTTIIMQFKDFFCFVFHRFTSKGKSLQLLENDSEIWCPWYFPMESRTGIYTTLLNYRLLYQLILLRDFHFLLFKNSIFDFSYKEAFVFSGKET